MGGANLPLGIVVTAVDRASAVLANVDHNTRRLADTFDSFRGRLTNAFQYHVIYRGLNLIDRGIGQVLGGLGDLVGRGREWAATVDDISDATGMSARASSEWAAVQQIVSGNTEGLSRALVILARNAATNKAAFDQLGIATRGSNGRLLSTERILQNVRERISETGSSLLSTAAAQKAFGRGAASLLDILTLTNGQWDIYVAQARRSGLVLTEAGLRAAEQWERTRRLLDATWTGIGAQVLQAVAPALISLSNGVTRALQDNLANITRFAVQVVNFLAGLVGGFLGIDFGMATVADRVDRAGESADRASKRTKGLTEANLAGTKAAKGAASGQDAYSRSLQRSIDAIDRQLKALDRADRRDESRRTQRELLADIAEARKELADVRSQSVFAAGMSEGEAELARQAHARDVIDSQQRVRDAERRLRDERRDQERADQRDGLQRRRDDLQRMLSAHQQAAARVGRIAAGMGRSFDAGLKPIKDLGGKGIPKLTEELEGVAEEARRAGQAIADSINEAIFGTETSQLISNGVVVTVRQGGLIAQMQRLADFVSKLVGLLPGNTDALVVLAGALGVYKAGQFLTGLLPGAGAGAGAGILAGGAGALAAGLLASEGFKGLIKGVVPSTSNSRRISSAHPFGNSLWGGEGPDALVAGWVESLLPGWLVGTDKPGKGTNPVTGRRALAKAMQPFDAGGFLGGILGAVPGAFAGPSPSRGVIPSIPGFGMADPTIMFRNALRPFLGPYSPVVRGVDESSDNTGAAAVYGAQTAGNTGPIGDGTVGVTNNSFAAIGRVNRWDAGMLGVQNNAFFDIGSIKRATIKIPIKASRGDMPPIDVNINRMRIDTAVIDHRLKQIVNALNYRGWTAASAMYSLQHDLALVAAGRKSLSVKITGSGSGGTSSNKP